MVGLPEYEQWKQKQAQASVGAASVVIGAQDRGPDEVAGDLNLATEFARETGNPQPPAPMVAEYRNVFQKAIDEKRASTILSTSPRLTEWLRDPTNAAIGRDDLEGLSWWETGLRAGGNAVSRGIQRVPQSYNQLMAATAAERAGDAERSFSEILMDSRNPVMVDGQEVSREFVGPVDLVQSGLRWFSSRVDMMGGVDQQANAVGFQRQAGEWANAIAAIPMSPEGERFKPVFAGLGKSGDWRQDLREFGAAVSADPSGFSAFLFETAAESIPDLFVAAGVTAVTRSPAAGAMFMGGQSALTEAGTAPVQFFQEKGIDVSTPEGALQVVSDPALMREAMDRGVIRGTIIGALDGLSGGLAGQVLSRSPAGNMALQALAQAFLGGGGEAAAQVASGQEFNIAEVLIEGLAEFATAPIEVAGVGGRAFLDGRRKAQDAEARQAVFQELSGQAVNSKVRARMPDKFKDLVAQATANGPVENVYVPAEQFRDYFQSVGVDPYSLVEGLDGVSRDDFDAALAGGGDLQIPTSTYAAHIAGSEHDAFLMENMRFDPDEFTAAEARDFNARVDEIRAQAEEAQTAAFQEEQFWRSTEQTIYDTMVERLRIAGRSTDVATSEALLYPAFYRAMAERSQLTTEEFLQQYPLPQVQGAIPQGMQARNVDEFTRTLAAARSFRGRRSAGGAPSLLEFIADRGGIVDRGGELKARDAATVKRGRGKKTLQLLREDMGQGSLAGMGSDTGRRYGPDDVAQAAIEAGFMADNPIVQEYRAALERGDEAPDITRALWDEIDAELRGREAVDPNAEPDQAAYFDEIEAYLDKAGVTLDDEDAAIRAAIEAFEAGGDGRAYAQGRDGARGLISISPDGAAIIRLFETANLSTFVHESGHYFLTVMQDMAARGEPGATTDFEGVKTWWRENAAAVAADGSRVGGAAITAADVERAIDTGTTGDAAKDAAVDVGMQEQFARGFEQYLMEGRAPSAELRGAFEKFRAWMVSVYKKLTGLNVKVSDEMRGVFDRMLASDAEIARAKQEAGQSANVLPTAEAMGLTDEEYQRFLALRDQAEQSAQARLLREIMEPVRREQAEWYKAEKAKVREAVTAEVNAMRQYRAIEWMGNRRWLDADAPEGLGDMRMSKDILVDRYGEGVLKTLPRGRQAVYAVEGGVDPDDAAGWFGFGSGDEMIRAMETAPKRSDAIRDETERRMYELHGDPMKDGAMEAAALDAVHTDRRGEWIAAELKAIAEVADTDPGLTSKQARAAARDTISRMKVRDAMNANRFLSAERKAGEEAARLGAMLAREKVWQDAARRRIAVKGRAGDVAGVPGQIDQANRSTLRRNETAQKFVQAKRRQLLNHALYMEARKVADEVGAAERYVAKLSKASTREKIAGAGRREGAQIDYLGAIDEVMTRYDFRRMSARGEDRRGALQAYVDAMTAAGRENELAIPEKVMRDAARAPYKTLPVEELRGVVDTLKNLEHVALRWNKLIDGQQQRALDEAVAGVVEGIEANLPKRPPGRVNTRMEALRNAGRQYLDLVLNASTMLREIDGFKEQGAAYQAIKAPIDAAMNRLTERRMKAAEDMDALYAVYSKAERRRMAVREFVPELGYSLSKWEKIAVALNTGNAGNLQRMTDPKVRGSMTQDQVDAILRTLDERDAAFIQSVWDYVGSFRADIAAREKRTTGVEPAWVEASPVTIAGRTLTGGYYPLKYDPRLSSLARDDQANEIAQSLQSGRFGKAQTKNGHTKDRATSSGRAVDLDMSVLHRHVQQVIHDLELSEPVANSWRILQNGQVRDALRNAGRAADFDAMEIWLKDVAEGQVNAGDWVSVAARTAKSNFTAAKLAFNISTVAVQVTGISQSMVITGKRDFARGVQMMFRQGIGGVGQQAQDVAAKSAFMRERQTTFNKDIYDFYEDPKLGPTASRWGDIKREVIGPLSFWLMTKVQYYSVDLPTWFAGYQKGLRDYGGDEARAIALADDMVKRAQASGLFSDAPAIQRGSVSAQTRQNAVVRLFTTLGSYMFAKFNVAYERSLTGAREVAGAETRAKAVIASLSWAADMAFLFTLEAVVIAAIKGRLPDEEEDEDDTWGKFLAKETAMGVMGTLPFVRDVASTMGGFEGGGAYGGITKEIAEPFKQAVQGEVDAGLVKSIISATGLATGIPSTQINRAVDAGWREVEGQDVSPLEYILGKLGK